MGRSRAVANADDDDPTQRSKRRRAPSSGENVENVYSDTQANRSLGVEKPKDTAKEGPSLVELFGYNPKRQEFDPGYDNDAEQLVTDMDFKENDPETERELKLRVLHIYSSRLDERKR